MGCSRYNLPGQGSRWSEKTPRKSSLQSRVESKCLQAIKQGDAGMWSRGSAGDLGAGAASHENCDRAILGSYGEWK